MAKTQKDRMNTIIAIINSNTSISNSKVNKLKVEFKQVINVDSVTPQKRKNILKILHATRGLDSTMREILDHFSIRNGKHSIGQFLHQFTHHNNTSLGKLSTSEKAKYQREIADVRNTHLHTADSYPRNDSEVYKLLSEMEALITRIASL